MKAGHKTPSLSFSPVNVKLRVHAGGGFRTPRQRYSRVSPVDHPVGREGGHYRHRHLLIRGNRLEGEGVRGVLQTSEVPRQGNKDTIRSANESSNSESSKNAAGEREKIGMPFEVSSGHGFLRWPTKP